MPHIGKKIAIPLVLRAIEEATTYSFNLREQKWCKRWPRKIRIGNNVYPCNRTLRSFSRLPLKCSFCRVEGAYFQQERDSQQKPWHLVPYGVTGEGTPVQLTVDHIVPKAAGGSQFSYKNHQILCKPCNEFKGKLVPSSIPAELEELCTRPTEKKV